MNINLNGALLNGDTSGTLASGGRLQNIQVASTAALVGTLTLGGAAGVTFTTAANLNGLQAAPEMYCPVFFQLSSAADIGKVRVTWSWT
jgi:hypothetical protein